MAKPRLEKVRALFYVLQQLTKRGCANFDTASSMSWNESMHMQVIPMATTMICR